VDSATPRDPLTKQVIGLRIAAHRELGPGLLESAYEECLCHELKTQGIEFSRQVPLAINYKGVRLGCGYRLDAIVGRRLLLKIKAVEKLLPIHDAQILSYLRLSRMKVGLLMNFNTVVLKQGIRRIVL
jgi:GxxExxY protein